MIILGLTGSIGMGKSTTAAMFAAHGVPVNDADAVVHELYRGKAVPLVAEAFPGVVIDGVVDRNRLSTAVLGNPVALKRLEAIVHPLVREAEMAFLARHRSAGTPLVVLDIPLLFEVGAEGRVDRIAVVSAPADVQRARPRAARHDGGEVRGHSRKAGSGCREAWACRLRHRNRTGSGAGASGGGTHNR